MKEISPLTLVFILAVFILSPASAENAQVKTVDEVKVVKNPKKPAPSKGALTKMMLEEEFRIGEGESEEEMFSEITSVAVDNDGNIYILDRKEKKVKVFDSTGKFVRKFGKQGQGPGEMNIPIFVQISPNNELVVEDVVNRKLMFFSFEGEFLKSISTAKAAGLVAIVIDSKANLIGQAVVPAEKKLIREVKKYDKDLNPLFTIDTLDFTNLIEGKINPYRLNSFYVLGKEDNIIYGYPEGYEIEIYNPEGKLIKRILKEYDPVKITKKDQDEFMERFPAEAAVIKDRIEFPKSFPAYQSFSHDNQGRLFVRTFEKGKKEREYYFDVFDEEGVYIAKMPLDVEPRIWKGEKLYAVKENEDGFQILICFRIRWEK
ncbi:MAG: 6-bladed beta-propeller [Candidatus Aminicenantes bacterium]|nr:6-bladed beta-propeller [Candidatus Aminicenantes bacterium]